MGVRNGFSDVRSGLPLNCRNEKNIRDQGISYKQFWGKDATIFTIKIRL
jgi:hypothetical protein